MFGAIYALSAGILLVLTLAQAGAAWAEPRLFKLPSLESSIVLFQIQIDEHVLTDSLNAFQFGQKFFLPLGEMSSLMSIGIRAYPAEGAGRGFIRSGNKSFSLSIANSSVMLADKSNQFDPADVLLQDDDIYVESKLLAKWLLVDFKINLNSLSIKLEPREPLALQARLARESKMAGLLAMPKPPERNYLFQDNPYKLIDLPFVDQTLTFGVQKGNGYRSSSAAYTTYIRSDFVGLQASAFMSGSNSSQSRLSRFTLGRSDTRAELLGPLKARSFAFGNVSVPGVSNISLSRDVGNGFSISNTPLDRPTRFDSHTLQGDLPPGWDVELYLNNVLTAYQQSRTDGKYVFSDLSLVYGPNEFRLVFHGPQGQLRVERENFLLDGSLNMPGSFYYNVASNRNLLGLQNTAALTEWGLSKYLTGTLGIVNRQASDGTHTSYTSAGLHGFVPNAILVGNLTRQSTGGSLAELSVRSRLAGMSVSWSHLQLYDFTSDLFPVSIDPVRSRDQLRFDGLLMRDLLDNFPFTVEFKRDRLQSNAKQLDVRALLSTSVGLATVSNSLHLSSDQYVRTIDDTIQVSGNVGPFRLGGQASYLVRPQTRLAALALSADRSLGPGYILNGSASYAVQDAVLRLTSGLTKSLGHYAVAITAGYSSRHEFNIGIQIFTGIARDPRRSAWMFDAIPVAESGAVSARVFIEKNAGTDMDTNQQPVKNIGFLINSATHPARTDDQGVAYIGHLLSNRITDISINLATVEDPQLLPVLKGLRVIPRPGNVSQIDLALVLSGEIDGTVYLMSNGRKRGVGNVLLQLVDKDGKIVAETRSGSDGFFVVVEVIPGAYTLQISQEQLNELKLSYAGARTVTMSTDGSFINGQDFSLQRQ